MPKNKKGQDGYAPEENQDERFRTFFTTSVADIPLEMTREYDEPEPKGLFERLFGRSNKSKNAEETPQPTDAGETGEILLGAVEEEPMADLELAATQEAAAKSFFEPPEPEAPQAEQPAPAAPAEPAPAPVRPEPQKEPEKPEDRAEAAAQPEAPDAQVQMQPSAEPEPELPQEEQEDQELAELKALLRKVTASGTRTASPAKTKTTLAPKAKVTPVQQAKPAASPQSQAAEPKAQPKTAPAPVPEAQPAAAQPAQPAPVPVQKEESACAPQPVPAPAPVQPPEPAVTVPLAKEPAPVQAPAQEEGGLLLFGTPEDEKGPAAVTVFDYDKEGAEDDTEDEGMSVPLMSEEQAAAAEAAAAAMETPTPAPVAPDPVIEPVPADTAAPEPAPVPAPVGEAVEDTAAQPEEETAEAAAEAETEPTAEAVPPAEEEEELPEEGTPENVAQRLKHMSATLTLRCALSGILALVLLHLGLVAEGLVSPFGGLDPLVARTAFYGVNLLLFAAELGVSYTVLRDGLEGLRGRPSSETMPALAAVVALGQALIALINSKSYQPSSLTLLTGVAALGLFMALLGDRVMLAAVNDGFTLLASGVEQQGAYRARNKDVIRSLARDLEQKDPWILLSHPLQWQESLVERCFDERASERRTRKVTYILLAAAVISGLLFLIFGAGINGCFAAATAVLCMGAPLSSTLIPGLVTLRLQHTAGTVGAVVPGWAAIEELGGIDTVQVDAEEIFPAECAMLEDIRIFKGGRIDRALLYAASILDSSCNTLRGLFRQIIEERTDILFPVKDLETHHGLGFSAWCDNNRVLLGTRAYMEQEGVLLPEQAYEDKHSQNGKLQIMYLAVSGSLHAMFVLRYKGSRRAARGLDILQRENIRVLVSCQDPSLTARHITEVYHLPEGMVTLLDVDQCDTLAAAAHELPETLCCMVHLKGFASLTGGLRAAEQAQNAETAATTVQIVSILFSVFIAVLLTSAGSVGAMSVVTVLMYQAAWSALSIAVCALKQYR